MQLTVLLAALLSAPPSPQAVGELLKDVPGQTTPATVPSGTVVDGVNVMQTSCTSKAPAAELKAFFVGRFRKLGLYLSDEANQVKPEKGEQVTGLDTENLISYTVLLQTSGKATTVVMAVTALDMSKLSPGSERIGPVFLGVSEVTSFRLEGVQAMTYAVKATPADVKAFYRETLKKAGWVEREGLVFAKGRETMTVTVSPGVSEQYVMVQLQ